MKTLILSFFAALLYLTACDGCPEKLPTVYMSDEMKQYIMHPVGSYWIYQDSATGAIDSIYLKNQTLTAEVTEPENCTKYETVTQVFISSHGSSTMEFGSKVAIPSFYSYYLDSPKPDGQFYVAYYDSLKIGEVYYKDVKYFRGSLISYKARNIGAVRIESGGIWNLIRYHIKK